MEQATCWRALPRQYKHYRFCAFRIRSVGGMRWLPLPYCYNYLFFMVRNAPHLLRAASRSTLTHLSSPFILPTFASCARCARTNRRAVAGRWWAFCLPHTADRFIYCVGTLLYLTYLACPTMPAAFYKTTTITYHACHHHVFHHHTTCHSLPLFHPTPPPCYTRMPEQKT